VGAWIGLVLGIGSAFAEVQEASRPAVRKPSSEKNQEDAEGTRAPSLFKTEPVFKSRYQLHGQTLEVDTD